MATTKTTTVLADNVTLTAGSGDSSSTVWSLLAGYGGTLFAKITNGATGPTIAAQTQIWASPDNTNWYKLCGALIATLGNNVVTSWTIPVPIGVKYLYCTSGSNTGQNVVLRLEGTEVVSV